MPADTLLTLTPAGLYCPAGDFYIDPWRPVPRAVITHAHSDHARPGCSRYLAARPGEAVLRSRLGSSAPIEFADYGQAFGLGAARVSLHPAGHVLGSAQVRIEHRGEVWVVSGDYKLDPDPTCAPFELVRCHTFVTESTFALPIYRWPSPASVFDSIHGWWQANQAAGRTSVIFAYAVGKAQRLLAGLDPGLGPLYVHGAVDHVNSEYARGGVTLPPTTYVGEAARTRGVQWHAGLVVAPTSAQGTPWLRRFGELSTAHVSGWMRIRGMRRRQATDRGFVLSDHADWPGLTQTIAATGAERVWATHGYAAVLARWCAEQGLEAQALDTRFGEEEAPPAGAGDASETPA